MNTGAHSDGVKIQCEFFISIKCRNSSYLTGEKALLYQNVASSDGVSL